MRRGSAGPADDQDRPEPAFAIDEPVSIVSPLVFASPHSGRIYPERFLSVCSAGSMALRRIEDAYVDRLLCDVPAIGAPVLRALIGRACIDLNRAPNELDADMFADPDPAWRIMQRSTRVEAGIGCLPRVAHNGAPIYAQKLTRADAEWRLETIYHPYHRALEALLERARSMFGSAWLIDCHSMPSEVERPQTAEIVLGDRYGETCTPAFMSQVEAAFRSRGYSTARNAPYAGGHATVRHGLRTRRQYAVQIEIRRDLYLDETRVEPHDGLIRLRQDLTAIFEEVSEFARTEAGHPASGPRKRPRRMPTRPRS
ncbi:MAG: N-formylglutamate amidohydrolase [Hyphomonadaceae bacterium]